MENYAKMKTKDLLALETEMMVEAVRALDEAIGFQVEGDYGNMRARAKEVVKYEKMVDRVKDAIVEKMFGRDRLPFSKGDRFEIINRVDGITDIAEIVARKMVFLDLPIPDEIKADYRKMSEKTLLAVTNLKKAVDALGSDLRGAKELCKEVEAERRVVRDTEWEVFPKLLSIKIPKVHLVMLKDLIEGVGRLADRTEDFSDNITALAVKYSSLR
ncbi:MAG: DUF47 domain-containing protein [Promethearchaeota archaeon]